MNPLRGFVRDTAWLSAGLAVSQGVLLLAMPWWSRLYGPAEFAALGLWTAVVAVVSMLLLLRYDTCIVIAASDEDARGLLRLCLLVAAGGGVLLALVAWMLPAQVQATLGLAALGGWLPLAVLAGAMAAALAAGLAWTNRRRDYRRMAVARGVPSLWAALTGGWLGMAGFGGGLLVAHLIAGLVALSTLRYGLRPATPVAQVAQMHAQAPRYLWPAAMLDAITQQLPLLLTALWFSAEVAGQFSLAWRATALPMLMLAGAAGSVFYQRFSQLQNDPAAARELLLATWRLFALIGALPVLVVTLFGEPLFAWVFGDRWAEAGAMASLLMPMLWAMLISSPTSGALIVLGLQRWALPFGVAMLVYRPLAFWIGAQQGSVALGLALWAACECAAIVLYNLLLLRRLRSVPAT